LRPKIEGRGPRLAKSPSDALSTVAVGLAAATPGLAASLAFAASTSGESAKLNALFDAIMAKQLRQSPETATSLGLDVGELAWTKAQLADRSFAAIDAGVAQTGNSWPTCAPSTASADRHGRRQLRHRRVHPGGAGRGQQKFSYAGGGSGAPYVLSQLTGSYQSIPTSSTPSTASRPRPTPTPICRGWRASPG
jgi:uncharacterized protein (DUF885 family)